MSPPQIFFLGVAVLFFLWGLKNIFESGNSGIIGIIVGVAVAIGVWWSTTDAYAESVREKYAEQKRRETPYVIREADGCKVYTFHAGDRWHYFTRCPNSQTTTESSRSVSCGKNCTRTETEVVE